MNGTRSFPVTHWSLVLRAGGNADSSVRQALEELCAAYWFPVYAFVRRQGHPAHEAEDLTQGFFARLLEKDLFASADPEKGRLRSFLLTCLRRYLADQRDRKFAAKRGLVATFSLDALRAEERYAAEPASPDLPPDRLFQRRWALAVVERSLRIIEEEFAQQGKGDLFSALRPWLGYGKASQEPYEAVADRLGIPAGTLKSHVSRLRERWREVLFQQVAMTLDDPTSDNIKAELAELLDCL